LDPAAYIEVLEKKLHERSNTINRFFVIRDSLEKMYAELRELLIQKEIQAQEAESRCEELEKEVLMLHQRNVELECQLDAMQETATQKREEEPTHEKQEDEQAPDRFTSEPSQSLGVRVISPSSGKSSRVKSPGGHKHKIKGEDLFKLDTEEDKGQKSPQDGTRSYMDRLLHPSKSLPPGGMLEVAPADTNTPLSTRTVEIEPLSTAEREAPQAPYVQAVPEIIPPGIPIADIIPDSHAQHTHLRASSDASLVRATAPAAPEPQQSSAAVAGSSVVVGRSISPADLGQWRSTTPVGTHTGATATGVPVGNKPPVGAHAAPSATSNTGRREWKTFPNLNVRPLNYFPPTS